jgi:hypothetical protein
VVGAAGWTGTAASAFTVAWERDSKTAQAVGLAADQVAGIVGWLAVRLSQIEAGLEQAADDASAHGVAIGPDAHRLGSAMQVPGKPEPRNGCLNTICSTRQA